jgi:hypothetical protein
VSDVFERIRAAAARVAALARHVRIDAAGLAALCERIASAPPLATPPDPAHRPLRDPEQTLAFVLSLDAINFGSGWFPLLRKREGRSGYLSIATALREHFESEGAWDAEALQRVTPARMSRILGQDGAGAEIDELMALYARALNDLGRFLVERFEGSFAGPVRAAAGRGAALIEQLTAMPFYRDVADYAGRPIPFYKRAQITVSDLASAFGGEGLGRFEDRARLTIFADNLVPHVLRLDGVLAYDAALLARIEAGREIAAGSPEEVEIRALALHAVELCVARLREAGVDTRAERLDHWLWNRGQSPEIKAHPRHRTRTVYY